MKKFSNLETKSVVKSEKTNSKPKPSNKLESKLKCKSKPKSKSKTLEKKSKEKDKLYFLKFTSSKSKKKMLEEDLIGNLLKSMVGVSYDFIYQVKYYYQYKFANF